MFFPCYSVPEVFAKVKISFWKWRKNTKMAELISFFFLIPEYGIQQSINSIQHALTLLAHNTHKDNNKLEITS